MANPLFRHRIAVIEWDDAHARNQAVEYEESEVAQLHRPESCKILALVIKEDEIGVSVYNEETGPTAIRGLSFIPRAMLKAITYYDLSKPRKPRKKFREKAVNPPVLS